MRQVGRLLHTSAETAVIIHEWHSHNRLGKNLLLQAPSKEPSWPTEATLAWVNFLNKYHTVLQSPTPNGCTRRLVNEQWVLSEHSLHCTEQPLFYYILLLSATTTSSSSFSYPLCCLLFAVKLCTEVFQRINSSASFVIRSNKPYHFLPISPSPPILTVLVCLAPSLSMTERTRAFQAPSAGLPLGKMRM